MNHTKQNAHKLAGRGAKVMQKIVQSLYHDAPAFALATLFGIAIFLMLTGVTK